ncbi:MAG: TetR/AcrR family transcriptional regulator [Oxalobacteraceae bacterium]|nr:MAG: TetR/AcrR family transcriptional regulator [Oxalobacteraceae bacterium]
MTDTKWKRRKEDRPAEIVEAATEIFIQSGYAGANLDDVAKRAGIAKGTLYRYFADKEALFRAVVQQVIATNLLMIEKAGSGLHGSVQEFVPRLLRLAADPSRGNRAPALARLVIAESQAFPDLAKIWHDNVVTRVLALLSGIIEKAQERGEVRAGDPLLHAFSIIGPMIAALTFREVFGSSSPQSPDPQKLAEQHSAAILRGLLVEPVKT